MASSRFNSDAEKESPENFSNILMESDSEGESELEEYLGMSEDEDYSELEPEETELGEILGIYDEFGGKLPMEPSHSASTSTAASTSAAARVSADGYLGSSSTPACNPSSTRRRHRSPSPAAESPPAPAYSPLSSPSREPRSPARWDSKLVRSPMRDDTVNVMVKDPLAAPNEDIAMEVEEAAFHQADEHVLGQGAAPAPRAVARRAVRARGRGRGWRRGQDLQTSNARWVKGDGLIETDVNDEDVSEELRDMVKKVILARKVTKQRVLANERKRSIHDNEDEELIDSDEGEDEALLAGAGHSTCFEWAPMETYRGERERFLPKRTGSQVAVANAYEAFRHYWDDGILSHIVTESNRYAAVIATKSSSFAKSWYDTSVSELLILFAFWMMLSIIKMPSIQSCFSNHPLLRTDTFRKMFSRTRYQNLSRALHLADNTNKPTDGSNRLYSLGPVIDHLNSRFQSAYIPTQNICIDESLTLWKGNLAIRQYIKTKAAKFGMKTFELCESSTGYLWSFFVYTGSSTYYNPAYPSNLPKSTAAVLTLVHALLDKGYTLFMDNWFNSPQLARYLKSRKTDCAGTLRSNRRDVSLIVAMSKIKEGQFVARHSGDMTILAYGDKKKKVTTISTFHGRRQGLMDPKPYRPAQYKPQVILDYNKNMGGVDRKDQMLEPYLLERKRCAKWNLKLFKRFLNCSILNARILLQSATGSTSEHIVYRLQLVEQILEKHLQCVPRPRNSSLTPAQTRIITLTQNTHWPKSITNKVTGTNHIARRRCHWCRRHRGVDQRTAVVCSECHVPLCVDPCFELFHTTV